MRRWSRWGKVAGDERVVEVEGKGIWGEPRGKWGDRGEHGSEWGTGERTEASGCGGLILPLVVDGEAVRGDRAPVATGSVEQGRRPGVRWAGQCNGLKPREAGGSFLTLPSAFSFLFLFLFFQQLLHLLFRH